MTKKPKEPQHRVQDGYLICYKHTKVDGCPYATLAGYFHICSWLVGGGRCLKELSEMRRMEYNRNYYRNYFHTHEAYRVRMNELNKARYKANPEPKKAYQKLYLKRLKAEKTMKRLGIMVESKNE